MKWLDRLRYGRVTRDLCETCGARLREKQRVELVGAIQVDDFGGTAMIATYCTRDAPEDAA